MRVSSTPSIVGVAQHTDGGAGGNVTVAQKDIGARVYHDANQTISNATLTALACNSERYDTDSIHDNSTNNTRLTCITAGKYVISGSIRFAYGNTTGAYRIVIIRINGTTEIARQATFPSKAEDIHLSITTIYNLGVNDYAELIVYQNSGGNLNVEVVSNYSPEFMMQRIG